MQNLLRKCVSMRFFSTGPENGNGFMIDNIGQSKQISLVQAYSSNLRF
jgi:hypothetical protein